MDTEFRQRGDLSVTLGGADRDLDGAHELERYRRVARPWVSSRTMTGRVEVSDREIADVVTAGEPEMVELLRRLVEAPTTLGNEEPGQVIMEEAFRGLLGLEPADIRLDAEVLRSHPLAAPFTWDVAGKRNVVADWPTAGSGGRSLVLNGHVDVVGPASAQVWRTPPFQAQRDGDWLYGRGTGDMKAGLAAIVGAVLGLKRLGLAPLAHLLGETDLGPRTRTMFAAYEGLLFGAGVAFGLTRRPR